ncbi:MAG: GspE/PulE family protein [Patescibacteria group bacterium]
MPLNYQELTKVLKDSELFTDAQLQEIQEKAKQAEIPFEQFLVDEKYIADENLGQIVADLFGVPYINLRQKQISDEVLRLIPEVVAKHQRVIPFDRGPEGIKLAMADPDNEELIQYVMKKTGEKVLPFFATTQDIAAALVHYRKGLKEEFADIIRQNVEATQHADESGRELPATRIIDTILEYAYQNKASDIHIEPHEKRVIIRFRIDGILHDVVNLPKDVHPFIVTRVKIISRLRTDEHRGAQDGRFDFLADGNKVDVRVSILPIAEGEKVVLRILSEKSRQFNLPELGLSPQDLEKVTRAYDRPYGMILATGPTGSGKTTTLYAILKLLNTREVNISTIEDPVEYDVEGVNQIQVNAQTNLTFAKGLRSILRQDPDIIMVGEIRDEETAGVAINSAMTGHLVLSTLHTNDAPTTLPRLFDMKIEPFLIASTINVAIAQRLVRKIHEPCRESYIPTADEINTLTRIIGPERAAKIGVQREGFRLYRGKGCDLCSHTGYEGRIGIFEVMEITEEIRALIMRRANSDEIRRQAVAQGMTTMLDDGLTKVLAGITSVEEVLRASQE